MIVCERCGRQSSADDRFCANCGAPLAPQSAREERNVVTVLFADMVGSTARADQLDPEDVRAILAPFYARLRAAKAVVAEGRRLEADGELQRALTFYRSVGATRYIREAEALLAESA